MVSPEPFGANRPIVALDISVLLGLARLDVKQPSRRTSDPSEIGAPALWLCAREAHNITGTSIPVDGGWTAQ
ncbi:SDR family oxidoreductase [Aliiroseovarius sp. Z3]|uniref:SDR family oxidoreductase n=1 Tax=Aliiroseovarius sp. Z3 TaxID=2811402 RepID=UPI0023B2979C|nr:SDR family oxidoreductase [Aliiroseovarius sp. Z3]